MKSWDFEAHSQLEFFTTPGGQALLHRPQPVLTVRW